MKKFDMEAAITQYVSLFVIRFEMISSGVSVLDPILKSIERKMTRIERIFDEDAIEQDMVVAYLMEQR